MGFPNDRRNRTDRRVIDLGPPPGLKERRKGPRRETHMAEIELSDAEWEAMFGPGAKGSGAPVSETAAAVFDRLPD